VYDQLGAGWPAGLGSWLRRLGLSAGFFVLAQGFLLLARSELFLAVVWTGSAYNANLRRLRQAGWWQQLHGQYPAWLHGLTLLDAALVGVVLAIGLTAGLLIAANRLARWRALVERD
jgi:hypothetical protein